MAATTINLKGLNVVVLYTFFPEDNETGFDDEVVIDAVFALGDAETLDDDAPSILCLLGAQEVLTLEAACRADALNRITTGEEQ